MAVIAYYGAFDFELQSAPNAKHFVYIFCVALAAFVLNIIM